MASNERDEEDKYDFQLIEFISKGPKKLKAIDIVPSNWVYYDKIKGRLVSSFMGPPYDKDNNDLLHNLVKTKAIPPKDWPKYTIKIKGHASE